MTRCHSVWSDWSKLPGNPDVLRVPTSVLIFREHGMKVAMVGPDNKIELKPVTLGRNLGTEVEVLTGLTQADRVVNSPADSLASGDIVRIANQTGVGGDAGQAGAANEATAASGAKEH